jgi:hypothetical protein
MSPASPADLRMLVPLMIAGGLFAAFTLVRIAPFQNDIWWLSLINFLLVIPLAWLALRTRRMVVDKRDRRRAAEGRVRRRGRHSLSGAE